MACLLKFPDGPSRGLVTFTTPEWRSIKSDAQLLDKLRALRASYVTGLHFNWHDHQFRPASEFDFFMAGDGDLIPVDRTPYRQLPMDACNFTPAAYRPANVEDKFWDVLAVGNPVFFKRPEVVLQTIRQLFDEAGRPLRVLYICPIPKYRFTDEDTVFFDVRAQYEAMFSASERASFTLLTTNFDSPNPFDRNTLSVFFRNSKVFLHCATEERRCRIAAYAWCAGLPVVAYPSVASILPPQLRVSPGYHEVANDADYAPALRRALAAFASFDSRPYHQELSEVHAVQTLQARLASVYAELEAPLEGELLVANLDRRLGWHHGGIGGTSNGLQQPLAELMDALAGAEAMDAGLREAITRADYPERVLAGETEAVAPDRIERLKRRSIYLNPRKRRWWGVARAIKARLKFL